MSHHPPVSSPRSTRRWTLALAAFAALAVAAPAAVSVCRGEDASVDPDIPKGLGFVQVEKVQMVMVQAAVTDSKGRPALGLKQEDFSLFDENRPQEIEFFATESDSPIALAFLLDISGSMRQPGKLDASQEAIASFVDALGAKDRYGLICFADHQVAWITPYISNPDLFKLRLGAQRAYGQTALYDALAASPKLADEDIHARKAIVLFTDGLDNASELSPLDAVFLARQVSVPIYTVSFIPTSREMLSDDSRDSLLLLERFSRETGGALFTIRHQDDLQEAIGRIQQDLRSQYVIGFSPDSGSSKRAFRHIRVETRHSRLRVRTRTGYNLGS